MRINGGEARSNCLPAVARAELENEPPLLGAVNISPILHMQGQRNGSPDTLHRFLNALPHEIAAESGVDAGEIVPSSR